MIKHYISLGYTKDDNGEMEIDIKDLPLNSSVKVEVKCDICGNEKFLNYSKYNKNISKYNIYSCSHKCAQFKNKLTNIEKYGVDNAMKSDIIKKSMVENNLKNHGVEWSSQLDTTKNKIRKSLEENYGGMGNASSIISEKVKKTNILKYGTEYTFSSKEIKDKIKNTNLERYGVVNPIFLDITKEKIKNTNLERYGVENCFNYYLNRKKQKDFYNKKTLIKHSGLLNDDYTILSYDNRIYEIFHKKCESNFIISYDNFSNRIYENIEICTKCYPISEQKSIKEKEIVKWLKTTNIDFIEGDRTILAGKELDIYIPSKNLAIEFNGLYYHSELFKDKNYHLNKSLECQKRGIYLIHIWEDEWVFKQDIIKSIISNRLGLISNKIYARQCTIKIVDNSKLVRVFLDNNHIQGYSQSSIKIGLYFKDELVSLMTFGYRHTNAKKEFELIRFCNKINTNVVGAASKLFNYFKSNYNFDELVSYSDFRLFDGKMYETLEFEKTHISKPDYFWCKNMERKHRFNFNKKKLVSEGFDSSKTEVEIMRERGYYRIFGCGQYRWELKIK